MESALFGYDARELLDSPDHFWTPQRRESFLLRTDVARPLSTDATVWPSLFDTGEGIGMSADERQRYHFTGLPLPEWIGLARPLWEDLDQLAAYLSQHPSQSTPYWLIAIVEQHAGANGLNPLAEATIAADASWQFLGFDVSDAWLLSGLMNCGYTDAESHQLRPQWAPLLNEHHLFDDLEVAQRFRELSDRRVTEHAPFSVFGIWRVR